MAKTKKIVEFLAISFRSIRNATRERFDSSLKYAIMHHLYTHIRFDLRPTVMRALIKNDLFYLAGLMAGAAAATRRG